MDGKEKGAIESFRYFPDAPHMIDVPVPLSMIASIEHSTSQ